MDDIESLADEIRRLQEQQKKTLTFVTTQFIDLCALIETVLSLQRTLVTHAVSGSFDDTDEVIQGTLEAHRIKYEEIVQRQLALLDFLGDTHEGPVA